MLQILNGRAFRQKFGVGKDFKADAVVPAVRILSMARAVFTGRVLFSITILDDCENSRICRAVFSQY